MSKSHSLQSVQAFIQEVRRRRGDQEDPAAEAAPVAASARANRVFLEEEPAWVRPMLDEAPLEVPAEEETLSGDDLDMPSLASSSPLSRRQEHSPSRESGSAPASGEEAGLYAAGWDRLDEKWKVMEGYFGDGHPAPLPCDREQQGGLLVNVEGLQGFVPASQLVRFPRHAPALERDAYLVQQKGSDLLLKIIELDRSRNRLVLSERACIWQEEKGEALLDTLQSGDILEGVVSNLCDFGAFVDLGGIDGLIHISELSWRRVNHPQEVLKAGDRVQVYVLSLDREQKRVALSMKRLRQDPWATIEERYQLGQIVHGVVTNVVGFGAFARIEDGLEGLIHISELADGDFLHPRNVVQEGDEVTVRVLHIDGANRRLGLSLRQANP